jgi:hypothetical protein
MRAISFNAGQISFYAGRISLYAGQISFNAGSHMTEPTELKPLCLLNERSFSYHQAPLMG